jgi:hypothetical protein
MKENIIRKLTSRKFWVALVGFITPLLLAFGVAESDTAQITAIIIAGADVLGYLLAEGLTDAAAAGKAVTQEEPGDGAK